MVTLRRLKKLSVFTNGGRSAAIRGFCKRLSTPFVPPRPPADQDPPEPFGSHASPGRQQAPPRKPLGRMVWTGDPKRWRLQLYKWSDECWDEDNDAGTLGGTPEQCLEEAVLGWGA